MIPELGHYALILAFCLALVQASLPLVGAMQGKLAYMNVARSTALGQFVFAGLSFLALIYCFLSNDFSVAYVANHSNTHLPFLYRLCAAWGAHEGSLLLWVFILSLWTWLVSVFSRRLPLDMLARVLSVMAWIGIGFYLFLLTTSDPFLRSLPNVPAQGLDLNPILQDPGLALHPPMLYMGYVGFAVAFAFAMAALLSGRLDAVWARWSRPWTMIAWSFLTIGIVLGSWWAYRELGWGGFWFWDPVENASFLPWLVGTALIHSLAVTEKRNIFKAWTVLLAVMAFSLSLLGTFLVRSGILISVHAFAIDPQRGLFMLKFLLLVVGSALTLYAWRARTLVNTGYFRFWSRETLLLANNVLLFVGMLTILLGTLYPLVMQILQLGKLSVGAPYFNRVFVPMMLPLLFLMGIGPLFYWQHMAWQKLWWPCVRAFIFACAVALLLPWLLDKPYHMLAILVVGLACWIIFHTLSLAVKLKHISASQLAMIIAHLGVAITVIGLALTTAYSKQRNLRMTLHDQAQVGPYQFRFTHLATLQGPNYSGIRATFAIFQKQQRIATLYPELHNFADQQTTVTKTAINAGIFRDVYIALGTPLTHGAWSVRIYYKPFVRWIWAGGLLMVLGGLLAVSDRRYRLKETAANEN